MADDPVENKAYIDLTPSLLGKLRAGDAGAGALLDQLYRQAMIRFCWGYLGRLDDAEDAVQEIFCKTLTTATVPDNFRAWLYKVARHHCLNVLRDRERHADARGVPADTNTPASETGNLSRLAQQELRSRIGHLVSALPQAQQEVLRLRYTEELARAEIAYVLDIPESVVKSRLFEGLEKLREHRSLLAD